MKPVNASSATEQKASQPQNKVIQPRGQQPATATPPLNESTTNQMNVYQQLRKMDSELADSEETANPSEK